MRREKHGWRNYLKYASEILSRKNLKISYKNFTSIKGIACFLHFAKSFKGSIITEKYLLEKYPHLASEQILNSDGTCVFNTKYNHLNDLLKYDAKVQYEVLASPGSCERLCLKILIESKL